MKIYIDDKYYCHTTNPDGIFREVEVGFFEGKCEAYINGHRYAPDGESWIGRDGTEYQGVSPWKPFEILAAYQEEYERSGAWINELMGGVTDVQHE